jgi:antitoxin component of MazEF toxin-antitoxin module
MNRKMSHVRTAGGSLIVTIPDIVAREAGLANGDMLAWEVWTAGDRTQLVGRRVEQNNVVAMPTEAVEPSPQAEPVSNDESPEQRARRLRYDWRKTEMPPSDYVLDYVQPNPKHGQCAERYACYRLGMTVAEYQATVRTERPPGWQVVNQDIRWDISRGFVRWVAPKNAAA